MPIEIISPQIRVEESSFRLCFEYLDHPSAGFSFDCDKDGNVDLEAMNIAARENYLDCLNGTAGVGPGHLEECFHRYTQPAVGKCPCGELVELGGFTNTCKCGADYNWSGQLLAPRSQWGEDTGESLADILRIP